jgi:hypothetical protein
MPWVGFKLTILASERAKTVHALDRSATVTGMKVFTTSHLTQNNENNLRCFAYNVHNTHKMCNLKFSTKKTKLFESTVFLNMTQCNVVEVELCLLFDLEDGSNTFRRNFGKLLPDHTESHPR